MNDPDLQELSELWREPSEAEQEAFESAARRARRQGKLLVWADVALAAVLGLGVILGLAMKPGPLTGAVALVTIVSTTYVMWKRRQFRQMAPSLATSDRHAFLESSVRMAVSNVRRVRLTLYMLPLAVALGVLFKVAWRNGGTIHEPLARFRDWIASPRGVLTVVFALMFIAWTYRSLRRARSELGRLRELQNDYRDGDAADGVTGNH